MSYRLLHKTQSAGNRPPITPIHILDNDSLLEIFSLCRPLTWDESESTNDEAFVEGGRNRERWWYTFVHVCRRWRFVMLECASHLHLSLVCARGTPVAAMLANSPPLPIIIDHFDQRYGITAGDEQGIILALHHRDRVRHIRLRNPISLLQKFIIALDGEFPILEDLLIQNRSYPILANMSLNIPKTFRAPHLRHLMLIGFDIPIGSPLNTTMGNLVTLNLDLIPPQASAYFHPETLLQQISLMPHLKMLRIFLSNHFPSSDIERELLRVPIMTHVALSNLRCFGFKGSSAYLEALLPWFTFPLLEKLEVYFFNQLAYPIPRLSEFMSTAGNFRLIATTLIFYEHYLHIMAYPREGARVHTFSISLHGNHLNWQVASAAQIFHAIGAKFSAVEHLTLQYDRYFPSPMHNDEAYGTQWREILRTFINVETISIDDGLIGQLSLSLQPFEGESFTELLPELQELTCYSTNPSHYTFTQFIVARQMAGRPVTVINVPVIAFR